uniref:Uncharacterized protein n=1 Tax=Anopheles arabiensis TaxID=7173 RepID=A0A182IH91_ANOAR
MHTRLLMMLLRYCAASKLPFVFANTLVSFLWVFVCVYMKSVPKL